MLALRRILRYVFAFGPSKRIFNALLPRSARRRITKGLDLDTGPLNRPIDDVQLLPVQPDSYLAVYFKRYGGMGVGPGVSLYVLDNEILRFDCFGARRGHYHSLPCLALYPGRERIKFDADTVETQISRCIEEISMNYAAHLAGHFRPGIRGFRFEQRRIEAAAAEAGVKMLRSYQAEMSLINQGPPPPSDILE